MKNINELMEDLRKFKEEFIERKLFVSGQLGVLDKEINSLIKENAYLDKENDIDFSIKLSKKLKELELKRRNYKNEFKVFSDIDEQNKFTYNMVGYTLKEYDNITKIIERMEREGSDTLFKNVGTKSFPIDGKDSMEIDNMVDELKENFSKVFVNKEEGKIFCYNNCRAV